MGPHGVLGTCLWHLVSQQIDDSIFASRWDTPPKEVALLSCYSSRDSYKLLTKTPQRPLPENGLCPKEMLFIVLGTLPQLGSQGLSSGD